MTDIADRLHAGLADRYRIERQLGSGGMATVYLAEDLKHRRPVAIKVLRPELTAGLGPERFLREIDGRGPPAPSPYPVALRLGQLGADAFYYVMPYVAGESLRARIRPGEAAARRRRDPAGPRGRPTRWPPPTPRVVHRDIKPATSCLEEDTRWWPTSGSPGR